MNLLRTCFITLATLFVETIMFSQTQEVKDTLLLSVGEAQKYALEFNRNILSSKIDVEIAKKKVWETTAIGLPQVNLKADYQHLFTVPEIPGFGPVGVANNTTFTLTVSQLIFSGEYLVGLQASRVYKELSEKSLVVSAQKTRESVSTSYYIVLVLDENLMILNESLTLVSKTLDEITKMHEQGFTEDTDVDQMKINYSNLETTMISLKGQRDVAIKLLKLQMGMTIDQPIMLTDSIDSIINEGNFEYMTSPEFILEKSTTYQLLEVQENLMSLSLKREKSKYLPTIAGFYQHQQLLEEPAINFMPKDVIGISVTIPIFTSGQRMSKVSQAKMELDKSSLNKEQAGEGLILEFETALNTYQTAYKNYLSNKESIALSLKIYKKNTIKYKEGIISSLDLTQSQDQYLTSQRNYFGSVANFLNAKAALDRILSKG